MPKVVIVSDVEQKRGVYEVLSGPALVTRICGGDGEALLHLLVDRCGGFMRFVTKEFRYEGGLEQLTQDACVHLFGPAGDWKPLRSWNGTGTLESWTKAVIRNVCVGEIRKSLKQSPVRERLPDNLEDRRFSKDASPSSELERKERISLLLKAALKLKERRDRVIIYFRYLRNPPWTSEDLCWLLKIGPDTLRVVELRARRRFAAILKGDGQEEGEWEEEGEGEDHA